MNFAFTEEQDLLRETARRFLDDKAPSEVVRKLMESHDGYDPAHWSEIAQMGWQAMAIPEEYGGAGFSFLETVVLMEEMGRSVFPIPYLSTVILSSNLLLELGSEEQKQTHLPGISAGESVWALALTEPSDDGTPPASRQPPLPTVTDGRSAGPSHTSLTAMSPTTF